MVGVEHPARTDAENCSSLAATYLRQPYWGRCFE